MSALPLIFDLLKVGHCLHPECIVMRGGNWRAIEFPALVGLIRHPTAGFLLYDTGYSRHFMEATRGFPECLYRMVTPPMLPLEEELLGQLEQRNIRPEQIGTILISHFHADHVAGLNDFPNARFIATRGEYDAMRTKSRLTRLAGAFLSELLPADFSERLGYAEDCGSIATGLAGFDEGLDLLGDGSLIGVPLPGHTQSQLGLLVDRRIFLVGDACWKTEALERRRLPSRAASLLFADNARYQETFFKLADLRAAEPGLTIIPSHCVTAWKKYGGKSEVVHE